MKKLFCKIGVIVSLCVLCLCFFLVAYSALPILVGLLGVVCSGHVMRSCWISFVRLELAERRKARRTMRLPRASLPRSVHAA